MQVGVDLKKFQHTHIHTCIHKLTKWGDLNDDDCGGHVIIHKCNKISSFGCQISIPCICQLHFSKAGDIIYQPGLQGIINIVHIVLNTEV